MTRTTVPVIGWTFLGTVAVVAIDPASTVGGKPPAWVLFDLWALGVVLLGAIRVGVVGVAASGRLRIDLARVLSIPGAAILWTIACIVAFPVWALDARATDVSMGPGGPQPAMKVSEPVLFAAWAAGLAVSTGVWLVARARSTRLPLR
jgi:hypothetical protein